MRKIILLSIASMAALSWQCKESKAPKAEENSQPAPTTEVSNKEPMSNNRKKVKITTDYGVMVAELYDETPQHRDNFIKLVQSGFYDSLMFHRIIPEFMIQGGDPASKNAPTGMPLGNGGPGYEVPAEFNQALYHRKGALAAARTGDQINPQRKSSGSQFYIVDGKKFSEQELYMMEMQTGIPFSAEQKTVYANEGGTPFLDMQYTVFGQVVEGLDVITKISAQPRDRGDRPVKDIRMKIEVLN